MINLLRSKMVWLFVLVLALGVESHFNVNPVLGWAQWLISWFPTEWQAWTALAASVATLIIVWMFGWLAILVLVAVVVWPVSSLDFGYVDRAFYQIAQTTAADPSNFHQVSSIFSLLHNGAVVVGLALAVLVVYSIVKWSSGRGKKQPRRLTT